MLKWTVVLPRYNQPSNLGIFCSWLVGIWCLSSFCLVDETSAASADNVAALLANVSSDCANPPKSERQLRQLLFTNYTRVDRPKKNPMEPVTIIFSLVLEAIKDVSIRDHSITVSGYLYVNWYDDYMVWKGMPDFKCITLLVIPAKELWLPDIAMMNVPQKYALFEAPGEKVRVYPDGYSHFRPGGLFSAICEFDLTYFPYDEQECQLRFQSWLYLHTFMKITLDVNPVVKSRWTENEEWELVNMSGIIVNVFYSNPKHPYDGVYFKLVLRRRVGFFIMNVIIPGTIISLVELVTFTLDSGEPIKIHISFTCLLAFQVFQLMVIPELPQSSMHTPLLSIYIILEMSYIGLALVGQGTVFLLLHHSHRKRDIPARLLSAAIFWAKILGVNRKAHYILPIGHQDESDIEENDGVLYIPSTTGKSPPALQFPSGTKLVSMFDDHKHHQRMDEQNLLIQPKYANELEEEQQFAKKKIKRRLEREHRQHWAFIISVFDRFIVFIYTTLVVSTPFFMFMVIPALQFKTVRTLM